MVWAAILVALGPCFGLPTARRAPPASQTSPVPTTVTVPSTALANLAMLGAVALWSSATPATKLAVTEITVTEFVAGRLMLAAGALWLIVALTRANVRLSQVGWRPLLMGILEPGLVTRLDHDLARQWLGVLEFDTAVDAGAWLPGARRAHGSRRHRRRHHCLRRNDAVGVGSKSARRRSLARGSVRGVRRRRLCNQCADRPADGA